MRDEAMIRAIHRDLHDFRIRNYRDPESIDIGTRLGTDDEPVRTLFGLRVIVDPTVVPGTWVLRSPCTAVAGPHWPDPL